MSWGESNCAHFFRVIYLLECVLEGGAVFEDIGWFRNPEGLQLILY